jgi:hypothetical protein
LSNTSNTNYLIYIIKYIQIEIFNPSLQSIIVNSSELSVELKWPFDTKTVKFNKFSIIYKTNDSNRDLYFIQNGKLTIWWFLSYFLWFYLIDDRSINLTDENLQSCYKKCFQTPFCYFFNLKNGSNCSFVNQESFDNCQDNEICIKMNSILINASFPCYITCLYSFIDFSTTVSLNGLLVNTNYYYRVEINDFYNEAISTNYSENITSIKLIK